MATKVPLSRITGVPEVEHLPVHLPEVAYPAHPPDSDEVDNDELLLPDVPSHATGLGVDRLVASNWLTISFTLFFVVEVFDSDDNDCIHIARPSLPS